MEEIHSTISLAARIIHTRYKDPTWLQPLTSKWEDDCVDSYAAAVIVLELMTQNKGVVNAVNDATFKWGNQRVHEVADASCDARIARFEGIVMGAIRSSFHVNMTTQKAENELQFIAK